MFKGKRVVLRAFEREDMERQCMFENDPEMWFWDGGTPKPISLERLLAGHDASLNSSMETLSLLQLRWKVCTLVIAVCITLMRQAVIVN